LWLWAATLVAARLVAAAHAPVADCDEVFNYWEPLHYLLHGDGLQTWEYSPAYALRSYLYIVLHLPLALVGTGAASVLGGDKVTAFYLTRAAIGLASAGCELRLLRSVYAALGPRVAGCTLLLLASSAGMFHAAVSFLPSSFAMGCLTLASAHWLDAMVLSSAASSPSSASGSYAAAVWWVATASIVGWPFAALAGLPLALDAISALGLVPFLLLVVQYGLALLLPTAALDSYFYGSPVVSPFNMLRYNLNLQGGAQLYGTEPPSFYLKNLALNLTTGLPAALAAPAVLLCASLLARRRAAAPAQPTPPSGPGASLALPAPLSPLRVLAFLSPAYLWVGFFSAVPHKEERFLYPVYPLLSLAAAVAISEACEIASSLLQPAGNKTAPRATLPRMPLAVRLARMAVLASAVCLCASRSAALYSYYGAPATLYATLSRHISSQQASQQQDGSTINPTSPPINVCVGREWYRFPSSFFLPAKATSLRFVNSGFGGLLPAPFSAPFLGSRAVHAHFNDRNREEPGSYTDLDACDWMVELRLPAEESEAVSVGGDASPLARLPAGQWAQWGDGVEFLDAARSRAWSRALYLPAVGTPAGAPGGARFLRRHNAYGEYVVMERRR